MIIFLHGQDSYRSQRKLDEIILHYKESKKSGLNLTILNAKEIDFVEFYDALKTSSMFAEKKLVILKNVFENKNFQEEFTAKIKIIEALTDVVIVYCGEEPDQRLKLFKTLKKECKCQEFTLLTGAQLKKWAQDEFAKTSQRINQDAIDLLIGYVGSDLWRLSEEIKKLTNFRKNEVIKRGDIELMVKPRIELDIFKTIDALAAKNKMQALSLLHKHLDGGEVPLYLLSMIAFQFKNLLIVKELAEKGLMYASIVKKSGLHPFVVKKTYYACNQFTFEELKNIYQKIFQVDFDIKTGKIEAETALDLLIASI